VTEEKGKLRLNLEKALRLELEKAGVPAENISADPGCTCHDHRFYSYRAERTEKRMLFYAAIK
jgi:copper oxidase (laccase) domain-containing protein